MEEVEIAGYVCTWCWLASCRKAGEAFPVCGDLACVCDCKEAPDAQ